MIRGFNKCGVSVAIDGSEDNEIHIKDLEDYDVDSDGDDPFVSTESEDGDSKSDNDPFVSSESEDGSETDCSIDNHSSGDGDTIVISSESGDDNSQTIQKLSVPFDHITNPEHFSPFLTNILHSVYDAIVPLTVIADYTVFAIHDC